MNPEFNGFRQKELPITSVAKAGLSLQYRIMKNYTLHLLFSYSILSDELSPFKNNINMIGYGLNLGYESLLGPININVSKNDFLDIWRYISV